MRPSVQERARAFVAKARPSISGQGGHDATFAVACGLVVGFGLNDTDAWELLQQYNCTSCQPAWSEKDLRRKLTEARKQADRNPGEVGKLAEQDAPGYSGPRLPANTAKPAAKESGRTSGVPRQQGASRTVRTALFDVRPAGAGRSCAPSRTLRTLFSYSKPYGEKEDSPNIEWSGKEASGASKASERAPDASDAPKPVPAALATQPVKPRPVASVPVDTTVVWSDGEIYKKTWRQKEFHRFGNINDPRRG